MNKKTKTFLDLDIFSRICRQGDDSSTWIFSCKEKERQLLTPDRQTDRLTVWLIWITVQDCIAWQIYALLLQNSIHLSPVKTRADP